MLSLAVKYRPTDFDSVVCQESIIKILTRQLLTNNIKNAYLFCGSSGCGKTTVARIFANRINNGIGLPIEIDGASNSGVDNVREIIKSAQERSLDGEYKIYIIDECHALSNQAWQAFLKCIEETPKYTIFIFCTTDPQKIPNTILNRVMRLNFTRIPQQNISNRLKYICKSENFTNYNDACEYISKISNGQLRDAISYLEKVSSFDTNLSLDNVYSALGTISYDNLFNLINNVIDGKDGDVLNIINCMYQDGVDLKLFSEQFLTFVIDIMKFILFNNTDITQIPSAYTENIKQCINFDNSLKYYSYVLDNVFELKNLLKNDSNPRNTIETIFLKITRCG